MSQAVSTHMQVGGVIECDVLLPAAAVHALDLRVEHLAGAVRGSQDHAVTAQPEQVASIYVKGQALQ